MFEQEIDGTTTRGYAEGYVVDGDVLVIVELSGPIDEREFAQVFDAAQASVEIDGEAAFVLVADAPEWP